MVRLKLTSKMSVLKDVTIKSKNQKEVEVWIAILKTGVCFNSEDDYHDGFYYKTDIVINQVHEDILQVCLRGRRDVVLRFGSKNSRDVFNKAVVGYTMGIEAPCPSPASSGTPSPRRAAPHQQVIHSH
jgi:hypothetical protein